MTRKPNILVLGATGMLGSTIFSYLKKRDNIFGTSRKQKHELIYYEFGKERIDSILKAQKINYVINCIAEIKLRENFSVNYKLPQELEEKTTKYKFKLINISTDAVFSSNSGPVSEVSIPKPNTLYGKTKLRGEVKQNTINIRTSILGIDKFEHKGLLEYYLNNIDGKIMGYSGQIWSGATTLQLAKLVEWIIYDDKFDELSANTNVIHFAPLGPVSKYEILKSFSKLFKKNNVVKMHGKKVTRYLVSNYFDAALLKTYNIDLKSALKQLVNFQNNNVEKTFKD